MCYYFENKGVIDVDYIMLKKIDMIDWIVNFERKNEFEMQLDCQGSWMKNNM